MTDEGWQLQIGLEAAGYEMWGRFLPNDECSVPRILQRTDPGIVIVQDKREWDATHSSSVDKRVTFEQSEVLASQPQTFRLTVLKDAHQRPEYHAHASQEIGCHAWIVYYHPDMVCHLAPWVRKQHLVRTYHSVDTEKVPPFTANGRSGCLLSGAIRSKVYPLRRRLSRALTQLPEVTLLRHPGYHARGHNTPDYLRKLSTFKVAICTSSIYGYVLRKIIEATACGCAVVTDLPMDDPLPEIDDNLIRVRPDVSVSQMGDIVKQAIAAYDGEQQEEFARRALAYYDYKRLYRQLANDIDDAMTRYPMSRSDLCGSKATAPRVAGSRGQCSRDFSDTAPCMRASLDAIGETGRGNATS
jgi:hypothetical protein